jgi:methyltransferase (TIGR00027 family)
MKNEHNRRIETKASGTADIMCLARAASYKDKRECYSGPDNVAYILVPSFFKLLLKSRWLMKPFIRLFYPKGMYEYIIARTKYIDVVFIQALKQGFDQVAIFGAGLDSRALRFQELNQGTRIFELDAPITQQQKLKAYRAKKLSVPNNLTFVPIDFNKDNLAEKIEQAGFITGRKTLFIMEGVTMYLSAEAVDSTFHFISEVSGTGSLIVFDYIHGGVIRGEGPYFGEKDAAKRVAKLGEAWTFALEEKEEENFLGKHNIQLQDHSRTQDLEDRYFKNSKGVKQGKINGTHAIITGIKK